MIKTLAKVVATVVAAPLILIGVSGEAIALPKRPHERPKVIHEDDPRWDCRTMGNRVCGVRTDGVLYLIKHTRNGKPYLVTVMR